MTEKIAISYLKTRRKEVSGYKRHWLLRENRDNSEEERKKRTVLPKERANLQIQPNKGIPNLWEPQVPKDHLNRGRSGPLSPKRGKNRYGIAREARLQTQNCEKEKNFRIIGVEQRPQKVNQNKQERLEKREDTVLINLTANLETI